MRHFIRRLLAAVALAAAAVMVVPAAPAQAGSMHLWVCFEVGTTPGGTAIIDCYWIEVPTIGPRDPWPPDCPECLPAFDFWKYDIDPVVQDRFDDFLGKGFEVLAHSNFVKDPKLAEQLRLEAAELFYSAAKAVEKYPIELDGVGWYDAKNEKYSSCPQPVPWHLGVGTALAAGIGQLQADLWDPQPDPPVTDALKHFDEAYSDFANLAAS